MKGEHVMCEGKLVDFSGQKTEDTVQIRQNTDFAEYAVESSEEGWFGLKITARIINGAEYRINFVVINGKPAGELFVYGEEFSETIFPKAYLHAGRNTVRINPHWCGIEIKGIALTEAQPLPSDLYTPIKTLCGNRKIENVYRLYDYLVGIYGKQILSGQQVNNEREMTEIEVIHSVTGKYPAVCGLDFIYRSGNPLYNTDRWPRSEVDKAVRWWKEGGIVTFCWHWLSPMHAESPDGIGCFCTEHTKFDIAHAMENEQGPEYQSLIRDMDLVAGLLKQLETMGIPVLWRPLHEASGAWFWWGAKGAAPYIKLWRTMFERFEYHHKLKNLIWVFNAQGRSWYPGDDVVDIIGEDVYVQKHDTGSQYPRFYEALRYTGARKMIALSENGVVPSPEDIRRYGTYWLWFCTWCREFVCQKGSDGIEYNPEYTTREALLCTYNDPLVITRDHLPSFR